MRQDLRYAAELSLLYAIPITSKAKRHSRLENLQLRIQKIADKSMRPKLNTMRHDHNQMLVNAVAAWGKLTGWQGKNKDIGTIACFCAQMIDDSPCKFDREIVLLLGDIIDHLDAAKKFYPLSVYAGQVASDKWQTIMNKE